MTEKNYKVSFSDILLTVTYFAGEFPSDIKKTPSELFSKIREIHRHSEHEVFFV